MAVSVDEGFAVHAERYRGELLAHCYRMLGSLQDAEDVVQETYLRAWRGFDRFEGRSSVRTWLYRIATRTCLTALQHHSRRTLPSGIGAPDDDPEAGQFPRGTDVAWLGPFPDVLHAEAPADPATVATSRQSLRLALVAALQHLPPRQRAVLILRDVLAWRAAEVAELLDTTTVAVNSALQRARAELARLAPAEDELGEPAEPHRRALLDRYATALEEADLAALHGLLTDDVQWEMPPILSWFAGRDAVLRLLAAKLSPVPGSRVIVPTSANGQPAFALYVLHDDGLHHAHSIQVLTLSTAGVSKVVSFHNAGLFPSFGFPLVTTRAVTP